MGLQFRATRLEQRCCQVLGDDGWRNVALADGRFMGLAEGLGVGPCLDIDGDVSLLVLDIGDGRRVPCVLDREFRFRCRLEQAEQELPAEELARLKASFGALLLHLRRGLVDGSAQPFAALLQTLSPEDGVRIMTLADVNATLRPVAGEQPIAFPTPFGPVEVTPAKLSAVIARSPPPVLDAVRGGGVQVPGLSRAGPVDAVFAVAVTDVVVAYLCCERASGLSYYVLRSHFFPPCLYEPQEDVLYAADPLDEDRARAIVRRLTFAITPFAAARREPLPLTTTKTAVWTMGINAFSHAIWDEMHTVDAILAALPAGAEPPMLVIPEGRSAIELYAPAEILYPELEGRVLRVREALQAITICADQGSTLLLRRGRLALRRSRVRIQRAAERHARQTGLAARIMDPTAGAGRLTLTLSIRLTNRRPNDLLGFYTRLTKAARDRFGPLRIVIDGIVGASDGRPAAPVYNGNTRLGLTPAQAITEGSDELRQELSWVEAYRQAVEGDDVVVVSCVGAPILEAVAWMSQSAFFVALLGGGLAKQRWALDLPGYVLSSRTNLQHSDQLRVFVDPQQMEAPFQALYFNELDEVEDLPLDPPRTTPAVYGTGIPHPENFRVDEGRVIARILDLIARHAPRFDSASSTQSAPHPAGELARAD